MPSSYKNLLLDSFSRLIYERVLYSQSVKLTGLTSHYVIHIHKQILRRSRVRWSALSSAAGGVSGAWFSCCGRRWRRVDVFSCCCSSCLSAFSPYRLLNLFQVSGMCILRLSPWTSSSEPRYRIPGITPPLLLPPPRPPVFSLEDPPAGSWQKSRPAGTTWPGCVQNTPGQITCQYWNACRTKRRWAGILMMMLIFVYKKLYKIIIILYNTFYINN